MWEETLARSLSSMHPSSSPLLLQADACQSGFKGFGSSWVLCYVMGIRPSLAIVGPVLCNGD